MTEAASKDGKEKGRVQRHVRQEGEVSDADALAVANATIKARDEENATLRTQLESTTETVVKTANTASETALARIADRETSISNGITGAKTAVEAAQQAWRSAREAGDMDAEQKANDALLDAKVSLKGWEFQDQDFKANKERLTTDAKALGKPQVAKVGKGPTPQAKQWLDDHPLMNTDMNYRRDALAAHAAAIAEGHAEGSDPYIIRINDMLGKMYGADHGKPKSDDGGKQQQRRERAAESEAAGPGRESSSGVSFRTPQGTNLRVSVNGEGKKTLHGDIPAEWQAAARWSKMDPIDYAISQVEIAQEREGSQSYLEAGVLK